MTPSSRAAVRSGAGTRRPAVGYVEVPDFHVEVVRLADPSLRARSILVGGDPAKRGKVLALSPDLRERGIVVGIGLAEALDRAPDATWVRTDMPRAREISGRLRAVIRREIGEIETDGLAGFYFRAPDSLDEVEALAQRLERGVAAQTGLPVRFGVAPARFAAALAAQDAGRKGARVIEADGFERYLLGLPLERLPGVGPKTASRLAELGARDVAGLRNLGVDRLEVLLGNHGRALWLLACGEDPKPLRVKRQPHSLSREQTLVEPVASKDGVDAALLRLSEGLESALRREGLQAGRLALRLTTLDARSVTRSRTLERPVTNAAVLLGHAQALLERLELEGAVIRRVAIVLGGLEVSGAEDRQLALF